MRPPLAREKIVCPVTGERLEPAQVWDSEIRHRRRDETVSVSRTTYGVFKVHHHQQEECPWSGHIVDVVKDTVLSDAFTDAAYCWQLSL